jgi:hypothetical protein
VNATTKVIAMLLKTDVDVQRGWDNGVTLIGCA